MQFVLDVINVGVAPNDNKGDDDRTAWTKQNTMNAGISRDLSDLYESGVEINDAIGNKLDRNGDGSALTIIVNGGYPQSLAALLASLLPETVLVLSRDPTTSDIPSGQHRLVKNLESGTFTRWVNDGGTMINLDAPKAY